MNTRSTKQRNGGLASCGMLSAVFCIWCFPGVLSAEIPSVRSSGPPQTQLLVDPTRTVVFPEQSWQLAAANQTALVVWSIEPFRNVEHPTSLVDAGLSLNTSIHGNSHWSSVVGHDRTNFAHQYPTARVAAASHGGGGQVGITVTFLNAEQPILTGGDYQTTVIATITEIP